MAQLISISIVSHAQGDMVGRLLADLRNLSEYEKFEVLLVLNVPEVLSFEWGYFPFPLKIRKNMEAKGFAENHNKSYLESEGDYFCVLNPDVRLNSNPFPSLLALLHNDAVGLAAPLVLSPDGIIEDSARNFPTPLTIISKIFGGSHQNNHVINDPPVFPDWVGGMFMLFPRKVFQGIGGFDPSYFLYYEDVDLCARMRLAGWRVALSPATVVVHHAQRASRRSFRYARWHVQSMARFFCSKVCWKVHWQIFSAKMREVL